MNNELYHFGIKGMKWGIRRYQNPDGSLTEAGKRRKYKEDRKNAINAITEARHNNWAQAETKNRKAVDKKIAKELENNQAIKDYLRYDHNLYELLSESAKQQGIDLANTPIRLPPAVSAELQRRKKAADAERTRIVDGFIDEYSGAVLADIGAEDTKAGRDYVAKILRRNMNQYFG